jgi:hypothetical protein
MTLLKHRRYRRGRPTGERSQGGFGLAEVVIAGGLAAIIAAALMNMLSNTAKFSRKIGSSGDLIALRARLTDGVSCRQTFRTIGVPPNPCAVGAYVELRSENDGVLIPAAGGRIGDWTVRARCAAGGLDIRAARLTPGATGAALDFTGAYNQSNFFSDEMGGQNAAVGNRPLRYDWDHPKGRLFTAGLNGLCPEWFAAPATAVTCPGQQYMTGFNIMQGTPVCSNDLVARMDNTESRLTGAENRLTGAENRLTGAENGLVNLENRVTTIETNIPAGRYCVVQAPGSGCPAGFSAINPGTNIAGAEGALLGSFIMGGGSSGTSSTNIRGAKPGSSRENSFGINSWAFCCK